jgi:Fe-S-cluster-containing dehydrogenase component
LIAGIEGARGAAAADGAPGGAETAAPAGLKGCAPGNCIGCAETDVACPARARSAKQQRRRSLVTVVPGMGLANTCVQLGQSCPLHEMRRGAAQGLARNTMPE